MSILPVSSRYLRRFGLILLMVVLVSLVLSLATGVWSVLLLVVLSLSLGLLPLLPFVLIAWFTKLITRIVVRALHSTKSIYSKNIKINHTRITIGIVMALINLLFLVGLGIFVASRGMSGYRLFIVFFYIGLFAIIAAVAAFRTVRTEKARLVAEREGMTFQIGAGHLFHLQKEFRLCSIGRQSVKEFSNIFQKKINDVDITIFDYNYGSYFSHYDIREQTVILFRSGRLNLPSFSCPEKISYWSGIESGCLCLEGSRDKLIFYRLNELVAPEGIRSFLEEGLKVLDFLAMPDANSRVVKRIDSNILQAKLEEIKLCR